MIDFVKVGQTITRLRKAAEMTQGELASMVFVSRQALSKWELGVGTPSIDTLLMICQIFHISFEELLDLHPSSQQSLSSEDIFKGRDHQYVIQQIISGAFVVDLPLVFPQLSPYERILILRAIKDHSLPCDLSRMTALLTPSEHRFMQDYRP